MLYYFSRSSKPHNSALSFNGRDCVSDLHHSMKTQWITISAIAGLVVIESIALFNGIDGVILSTVIGAISLLAGVTIPTPAFLKGK